MQFFFLYPDLDEAARIWDVLLTYPGPQIEIRYRVPAYFKIKIVKELACSLKARDRFLLIDEHRVRRPAMKMIF